MSDRATIPPIPPNRPSRMSAVVTTLRTVLAITLSRIRDFNGWVAGKIHTSANRVLQAEIFAFGFTMIQIGEYFIAVCCWLVLAIICGIFVNRWAGTGSRGLISFLKGFGYVFTVLGFSFLVTVTNVQRDEKPWSNIQRLWSLPESYSNALQIPEFIVNPDEHYDEGAPIAGIPWKQGSVLTRIQLQIAPDVTISNVELRLTFDAMFIHGAQVSEVPGVILQPIKREGVSDWEGGSLDKNGNKFNIHSATPEDLENIKSYPASVFVFKQSEMSPELPIQLAFIGGNGYRLGNFTFAGGGPWMPHGLKISGHYDVRYRSKTYTIPVELTIHPQARKG